MLKRMRLTGVVGVVDARRSVIDLEYYRFADSPLPNSMAIQGGSIPLAPECERGVQAGTARHSASTDHRMMNAFRVVVEGHAAAMEIIDLTAENTRAVEQIAELLLEGFGDTGSTAWRTVEAATAEVTESLETGRISRFAIAESGDVLGWIAGIPQYDGNVWELHPLVVGRAWRRQGVGRRLISDLENQVAARGGGTVLVSTDDENDRTTLGGMDLYPDVLEKLRSVRNRGSHPFEFYLRVGYHVVGVIPDANGFGKPDILMAKRVRA
jgi:aminoglycoside 6'-N-acetyltransferase I